MYNVYSWIIYILRSSIVFPRMIFNGLIRLFGWIYSAWRQSINNINTNQLFLEIYNNSPDFASIFVFLVILCLSVFVYIKLRYPFWSLQPVFHSYDFWRYVYRTPFIIRDEPWQTKFCDFEQMKTTNYLDLLSTTKTKIVDLLRCKYIATDRLLYTITEPTLDTIMNGNSNSSYITTYTVNDRLLGFMSSRSMQLYFLVKILENHNNGITNQVAYYWDYICADQEHNARDYNISRRLIQTHEYNQRTKNPQIKVSLFKKEINLSEGIVPLIQYKTYSFMLKRQRIDRLPAHTHIQHIVKSNIHILLDFLEGLSKNTQNSPFAFLGISDLGVLLNLIVANQLYCFCLKHENDILGYYFFKNANIQYEDMAGIHDCDTLHFIASFNNSPGTNIFILGYLHAIKAILKLKKTFKMLMFDEISHNGVILPSWKMANPVLVETDCAYYLYNMCFPCGKFAPNKVLLL